MQQELRARRRLQIALSLPNPFKLAERDSMPRPVSNLIPLFMAVCLNIAQMLPSFLT
jgi:hypothetical protein